MAFLEQIVEKLLTSSPLRRGAICGNVWFLRAGDIWAYLFLKGTKLQGASKDINKLS